MMMQRFPLYWSMLQLGKLQCLNLFTQCWTSSAISFGLPYSHNGGEMMLRHQVMPFQGTKAHPGVLPLSLEMVFEVRTGTCCQARVASLLLQITENIRDLFITYGAC